MNDTLLIIQEVRILLKGLLERNIISQSDYNDIYDRIGQNKSIRGTVQFILDLIDKKEG